MNDSSGLNGRFETVLYDFPRHFQPEASSRITPSRNSQEASLGKVTCHGITFDVVLHSDLCAVYQSRLMARLSMAGVVGDGEQPPCSRANQTDEIRREWDGRGYIRVGLTKLPKQLPQTS